MNTIILIIILLVKKSVDANYSVLAEQIERNPGAPKFNVGNKFRITKYKKFFSNGYTKNWSK